MRSRTTFILLLISTIMTTITLLQPRPLYAAPRDRAVWVFSDEVTNATDRLTLVQRSAASGVTDLYVSVYQPTPNAAGRLMFDDAAMLDLIDLAHHNGIQVWTAYGAPDWPSLGCASTAFPLQRMAEVVAYNKDNPSDRFDGVVLDVEPAEPQSTADFQALLGLYDCIREFLPNNVRVAVAIRFFWQSPDSLQVQFPAGTGATKQVFQHVLDLDLDKVIVMGYRDFAGPVDCSLDGILCLDKDEIAYGDKLRKKPGRILVGVETSNCSPGCGAEKVTFFEEGQSTLDSETQSVATFFAGSRSFGGFAIHRYKDSYLSGLPGWPTP